MASKRTALNYHTLTIVHFEWRLLFISATLIIPIFTFPESVQQTSLKMEPTMEDFNKYLSDYVGDKKELALLLDYDGTLASIASHPNLTAMTEKTKKALSEIAVNSKIFTAIISGRGVNDAKGKIEIHGLTYAGNHGLEILYPNGTKYNHQIPANISGNYDKMIAALDKITRNGSWIENKGVSLTFHYRAMPLEEQEIILKEAREIIESFGYRANQAHCAIEAKPPVQWNKGKAAEYILDHSFGKDWRNNVKVVFAGDDTTDEDVFELLKNIGVTFRVTRDSELITKATYKIPTTDSVTTFLEWIVMQYK